MRAYLSVNKLVQFLNVKTDEHLILCWNNYLCVQEIEDSYPYYSKL